MTMRPSIYRFGSEVIAKARIPQLFHALAYQDELTVVMYHGIIKDPLMVNEWCFVDEPSFRRQLAYLKKHFEIVSLSEAVECMRSGGIKRPTAVITFDDGYQNNYDVAFPILCEEGIPGTIFLATGFINTNDTVWYGRIHLALTKTQKTYVEWNGIPFDLSTLDLKARASAALQESLKKLEHSQLMTSMRDLVLQLDEDPDDVIDTDSPFRMLDEAAIVKMTGSGLIEFGAHTHHHAILSHLPDQERYNEIRQSIDTVYQLTGRPCRSFAYPNGRLEDYSVKTMEDLETCGIQIAVTTIPGPNDRMTPAMELRRYGIGADTAMAGFQLRVHHFASKVRRGSDSLRHRRV